MINENESVVQVSVISTVVQVILHFYLIGFILYDAKIHNKNTNFLIF